MVRKEKVRACVAIEILAVSLNPKCSLLPIPKKNPNMKTHIQLTAAAALLFFYLVAAVGAQESTERQNKENSNDGKTEAVQPSDKPEAGKSESSDSDQDEKGDTDSGSADKMPEDKSDDNSGEKSESKKSKDQKKGAEDSETKSLAEKARTSFRERFNSKKSESVSKFSKQSDQFLSIFDPILGSVNASTLQVVSGTRQVALGTVVDADGFVLTKASELKGKLGVEMPDGKVLEAKVVGIDKPTDLALLKIEATGLPVGQWSADPTPETGRWLATPKAGENGKATIGVVSVNAREIPPSKPFIGIMMEDAPDDKGVRITSVIERSPADFADVSVDDVIFKLDDIEIKNARDVREAIGQYDVNDRVTLGVLRDDKEIELRLNLGERDKISPESKRSNMQNSMGSVLSRRRKKFPLAFQHDSMLNSKTCGGPIVDLSGKIVGINIARAGRVSSLAIPVSEIRDVIEDLKTGEKAPEKVNAAEIASISRELAEMDEKHSDLPNKKSVLEQKYNQERARVEELNKSISDLKKRLKVIEEKKAVFGNDLKELKKEMSTIEKTRQRLEADLEKLRIGSR